MFVATSRIVPESGSDTGRTVASESYGIRTMRDTPPSSNWTYSASDAGFSVKMPAFGMPSSVPLTIVRSDSGKISWGTNGPFKLPRTTR